MSTGLYTRRIAAGADKRSTVLPARALRAGLLTLALAGGLASPAAAKVPKAAPPPPSATTAAAPQADRDRDRVFDDLEQRLARARAAQPVDVIVTLDDAVTADRVDRLERRVGRLGVRNRFGILDAFSARVTKAQVEKLADRPDVRSVERDGRVRALNSVAQQGFGVNRARIDNPSLDGNHDGYPARYSPSDMVAAVVDTGIYSAHRDLDQGKVLAFVDCSSGTCRGHTPFDNNGHGTHVSSILAGDGDARADHRERGVAPRAGLVGVKVLGADGTSSESAVLAGVNWAINNRSRYGIDAINLSLGGDGCSDGTDAMSRAADRAAQAGLVVVAAAGNSGPRRCTINSPGAAALAVTAGSMADPGDGGFLASWTSGRGAVGRPIKPDVMGPGVGVVAARAGTSTGYAVKSGTSMAAPFVTGVALLMRDANPALSVSSVKSRIKSTAIDWGLGGANTTLGSRGADIDFGSGRLNAYGALQAAGAGGLNSPPTWLPAHRLFEGSFTGPKQVRDFPIDVTNRCLPLSASLIMSGWNGYGDAGTVDFDLYLLDGNGRQVTDGNGNAVRDTSDERQGDFAFRPPATGRYILRVGSYKGAGNFFVDASAGLSRPPAGCG